jgi:hypothetical protein
MQNIKTINTQIGCENMLLNVCKIPHSKNQIVIRRQVTYG